ncbi:uncharacterized protein [Temnothorax nylanderi]|uniref:uncharacterized protein n=1 Tax=Temnothorax nylanderi TaxID=102681 RepID=UPI003A8B590F
MYWLKTVQSTHYPDEIKNLSAGTPIKRSSPLKALNPFLDEHALIRLGGRLANSALPYDERHPIILPRHRVSALLIDRAHKRTLHGGTQLTLRTLRQQYWLVSARDAIKAQIRNCVTCIRERAASLFQVMGNLPEARVTVSAPFSHTGVDYAGPISITPIAGRGQRARKYYIAVFVCMATKAVHLEYAEDYSTAGFLAAFKRFASRRGLPSHMYSDNGTNFLDADRELSHAVRSLLRDAELHDYFASENIQWHFNPPAAPHFGELWEAAVKAFKHHFRRIAKNHTLAQAELGTLICQIEACLNSRPIAALSDDPQDFAALTPGHFLIGRPLLSVPETSCLEIRENRLSRWQLVQKLHEQMWKSWSSDYLHALQQRHKWQRATAPLKVNELVLVCNNCLPPSKWDLNRGSSSRRGRASTRRYGAHRKNDFKKTDLANLPPIYLSGFPRQSDGRG